MGIFIKNFYFFIDGNFSCRKSDPKIENTNLDHSLKGSVHVEYDFLTTSKVVINGVFSI